MPSREMLKTVALQQTLQQLLENHNNEDVLEALSLMTGSPLSNSFTTPKIWSYEEVIEGFKKSEAWGDYAQTTRDTYTVELDLLTQHLQSLGINITNFPIVDLVLTENVTALTSFFSTTTSERSKNKKKSITRKFLRYGLRQSGMSLPEVERILGSKVFKIQKVSHQEIRYLEPQQISELLSKSILTPFGFRNFVMLAVYLSTGLRNSELTCLTINQVLEAEQILMVHRKRHKEELSPAFITNEGLQLLVPYITLNYCQYGSNLDEIKKNLGQDNNYVFFTTNPQTPITERTVQNVVKSIVNKCTTIPEDRKEKITPHSLRHSFAVNCVKNGVNFASLMKLMDHSSLNMLAIYLRLANKDYQHDLNKGSLLADLL